MRDGKGENDRFTVLPDSLIQPLQLHLRYVKSLHEKDLADGFGLVYLPYALERKYKNANKDWIWQYLFPATKISTDKRTGVVRRHHIHESIAQKAISEVAHRANIDKHVTPTPSVIASLPTFCKITMTPSTCGSGQVSAPFRNSSDTRHALSLSKGRKDHHDLYLHPELVEGHVLKLGGLAVKSPLDN